jgi:hypothetical protein
MGEMNQSTADFLKIAADVYADTEYGSSWRHEFILRADVSERTFRRWVDEDYPLPGPVRAMILAHQKCKRYGVDVPSACR